MAKKETKKENNKNKKSFFKDFKAELKKVNWPTPKQLLNNTIAVITIVFITAAIVFVLDIVFETLNKHGVDKIKEVIVTNNTTTENTQPETTTDNTAEGDTEVSSDDNQIPVDNSTENNTENKVE